MSIIKVNQDGKSHLKIVRLSEFKVNNQTYTINVQGIRVNGATHWVTPLHSSGAMRVIIMANVSTTTTGYMFGDSRFSILFSGGNVIWNYNGGLYSRPIEVGTHLFGFIDGRPYYDGSMLSSATVTAATSADVCYIGSANNPYPTPLNNASIIKVELYGHETDDADVKGTWSYYATRIGDNGYLIEKWANILNAHVGTQPTAAAKDDGTYDSTAWGISIDDLRQVVPTGLYDVTAIYTEDGGTVSSSSVEPEVFKGTINGTEVERKMAFRWRTDSDATLPAGFTKKTHSLDDVAGSVTGIHGELLLGRRPTWNMWADNVNMGRYIHGNTNGSDIRQAKIRFNPLKDKYGQDKPKGWRLEDWENYSPTLYHKPDLKVGALAGQAMPNITLNFVNGLCASLNKDYYQSDNTNTATTPRATPVLSYRRIAEVEGDIKFVLGNLVSWHEEIPYGDTSGNKIPIYGGYYGVRIGNSPDDASNNLNGMMIMAGWDAEDVELNSNSSIEIRNKYRDIGVSVEPSFFKLSTNTQNDIIALAEQNNNKITCYVDFGLLVTKKSNTSGFSNGLPNNSAMVSAHLITPQKNVEVELKKTGGYYVFADLPSSVSLVCDSEGDAATLPTHSASNTPDVFVLPLIHNDVSNNYNPTFEATLILYKDGVQAGIIGTKSSINKSQYQALSDGYFAYWMGETDHYVYKNGVRVSSSSVNNLINDGKVQFLVWTMSDILQFGNYTNFTEEVGGTRKFKSNISFKLENIKVVSETPSVEEITFTVGEDEYTAVKDMTWETWITSNYNTGIFHTELDDDNGIIYVVGRDTSGNNRDVKYDTNTWVESYHIIEPHDYIFAPLVG